MVCAVSPLFNCQGLRSTIVPKKNTLDCFNFFLGTLNLLKVILQITRLLSWLFGSCHVVRWLTLYCFQSGWGRLFVARDCYRHTESCTLTWSGWRARRSRSDSSSSTGRGETVTLIMIHKVFLGCFKGEKCLKTIVLVYLWANIMSLADVF